MNGRHNNTGFTLIEMLVALAIIATIVSMVYSSYAATSRSMQIYDNRLTCSQRAQLVLRLMARQLRGAYHHPTEADAAGPRERSANRAPDRARQTRGLLMEEPSPSFVGNPRKPTSELLNFITTAGLMAERSTQGLARIRYRYDPGLGTLSICCQPQWGTTRTDNAIDPWQIVLRQVTGIDMEFFDGRQWCPQWSGQADQPLPRAVRLSLTITDEKGRPHQFGTTVEIVAERKILKEAR